MHTDHFSGKPDRISAHGFGVENPICPCQIAFFYRMWARRPLPPQSSTVVALHERRTGWRDGC